MRKTFFFVENLLSDIPSAVKEFVEKNDTTRGGSFSESSGNVGNRNFDEDKGERETVEEIFPLPPKTTAAPPYKASPPLLHKTSTSVPQPKSISPLPLLSKPLSLFSTLQNPPWHKFIQTNSSSPTHKEIAQ